MSEFKKIIELSPRRMDEYLEVNNFICPECNGRGEFTNEVGKDKYESIPCSTCLGSGRLKARVVVYWSPEKTSSK